MTITEASEKFGIEKPSQKPPSTEEAGSGGHGPSAGTGDADHDDEAHVVVVPADDESSDDLEEDDCDDGPVLHASDVLEPFVKKHGWSPAKISQVMAHFWGNVIQAKDILNDIDAFELQGELEAYLNENHSLDDDVPPPKEDPHSPLAVLVKLHERLKYLADELKELNWKKESAADYLREVNGIHKLLPQIQKNIPSED